MSWERGHLIDRRLGFTKNQESMASASVPNLTACLSHFNPRDLQLLMKELLKSEDSSHLLQLLSADLGE